MILIEKQDLERHASLRDVNDYTILAHSNFQKVLRIYITLAITLCIAYPV